MKESDFLTQFWQAGDTVALLLRPTDHWNFSQLKNSFFMFELNLNNITWRCMNKLYSFFIILSLCLYLNNYSSAYVLFNIVDILLFINIFSPNFIILNVTCPVVLSSQSSVHCNVIGAFDKMCVCFFLYLGFCLLSDRSSNFQRI